MKDIPLKMHNMSKDPAFLFYSKDWIEGTAEYMPDEKGVYIDLLCFQHQRGGLPNDVKRLAKMVGLSEEIFNPIWNVISCHFEPTGDRLVNRRLMELMNDRSEKSKVNTVTGTFAGLLRTGDYKKEQYIHLKKQFKVGDFIQLPKERLTECISEWIQNCLKSIENGNENETYIDLLNKVLEKNQIKISDKFRELIVQWLKYKSEKHQSYKETGLKNFITKTIADTKGSESELEAMIIYSTSKNYDGLFKEKQYAGNSPTNSRNVKRTNQYWDKEVSVPSIQNGLRTEGNK